MTTNVLNLDSRTVWSPVVTLHIWICKKKNDTRPRKSCASSSLDPHIWADTRVLNTSAVHRKDRHLTATRQTVPNPHWRNRNGTDLQETTRNLEKYMEKRDTHCARKTDRQADKQTDRDRNRTFLVEQLYFAASCYRSHKRCVDEGTRTFVVILHAVAQWSAKVRGFISVQANTFCLRGSEIFAALTCQLPLCWNAEK